MKPHWSVSVIALACITPVVAQNAPLPAPPFPAPITAFKGRYLDSTSVMDFQAIQGFSTSATPPRFHH